MDSSAWLNEHMAHAASEQGSADGTDQHDGAAPAPVAFLGAAPATFDQNAPAAAANPNLKVLSPEEVQHELNA